MGESDNQLLVLAERQHSVFTLDQARSLGIPASTIRSRVSAGRLRRLHRGVFSVRGTPLTWRAEVMAAVMSIRGLGAASHRTAAHLCGLTDYLPRDIEVTASRHLRTKPIFSVVHESLDLRRSDIIPIEGIPVTSPVRTVVDLGASAGYSFVERCVDEGLRRQMFDLDDVARYIRRVARSGRTGIGTIRPIIEERMSWQGVTESPAEDLLQGIASRYRLEMPAVQFVLRDGRGRFVCRADFAYPDHRALIEVDSEKHHMDLATFRHDREKQNRAHALGWTVYRFTWKMMIEDPTSVASILASITTKPRRDGRQNV